MLSLKKHLYCLSLGWIFVALSACTSQLGPMSSTGDGQAPGNENNLANTKWRLVSFGRQDGETPVVPGSMVTLEMAAEGQAAGTGGCNSYGAHYEAQGNMVSFSRVISTLMACAQKGVGEQEQRYLRALETADRFALVGDQLTIWYDSGRGVLNFVKG